MKNKMFKILYAAAIILVITFVVLLVVSYNEYNDLLNNPLVLVAPFKLYVKDMALRWLIPAGVCAVAGLILQIKK